MTTTNADLITEARRVVLDYKAVASFALIDRLADALEASEAQVARLSEALHDSGLGGAVMASKYLVHTDDCPHSLACRCGLTPSWPTDLLETVQHLAEWAHRDHQEPMPCAACATAFAVLERYGLLPEEVR